MSSNYEKDRMMEGIEAVTFADLMEFADMLADDLVEKDKERIEPHVIASSLSRTARLMIEAEEQRKTELAKVKDNK